MNEPTRGELGKARRALKKLGEINPSEEDLREIIDYLRSKGILNLTSHRSRYLANFIQEELKKETDTESESTKDIYEQEILPEQEAKYADWLEEVRAYARKLGADGQLVCVNDIRAKYGPPPPEADARVMGAIFKTKGKEAEWKVIKRERTSRRKCHNRPIAYFQLRSASNGT